jgi:hypothetical protein
MEQYVNMRTQSQAFYLMEGKADDAERYNLFFCT